jgi:hypothetical protein
MAGPVSLTSQHIERHFRGSVASLAVVRSAGRCSRRLSAASPPRAAFALARAIS